MISIYLFHCRNVEGFLGAQKMGLRCGRMGWNLVQTPNVKPNKYRIDTMRPIRFE